MANGKFEIFQSKKNSEYYFRLKAGNGEPILRSEGYKSKQGCTNGVNSVKTNAPNDGRYERKDKDGKSFSFNLKAGNGEVVGSSESYSSASARDNGIDAVKRVAPEAAIVDVDD